MNLLKIQVGYFAINARKKSGQFDSLIIYVM